MKKSRSKFLIIDAHALIHRAYHALPKTLTSPRGELLNAVYGFTSVLIKLLKEAHPDYVAAAFDLAAPTFRHEAFKEYKGTRAPSDKELHRQVPVVKEVLRAFGIPVLEKAGFEADDIIGTLVEQNKSRAVEIIIATGDRDTLQLVEGSRVVVDTLRGGPAAKMTDIVVYDEKAVRERYGGLSPRQLVDLKGLTGDPSDNIPGVPRIGEKTAIDLLSRHKDIDGIYRALPGDTNVRPAVRESLEKHREQAYFSRELATIRRDVPLDFTFKDAAFQFRLTPEIESLLSSLGFNSLLRRIRQDVEAPETNIRQAGEKSLPPATRIEPDIDRLYREAVLSDRVYEIEKHLEPVLRRMEREGFRIEPAVLERLSTMFEKEISNIEKKAIRLAGTPFNLASPQEVGRVVFEELGLRLGRVKKTRTGKYSTAAGELEKLRDTHPVVPLILRCRELSKLKNTYLDTLPRLIDPRDGRVHTTFRQFGAATGRLSSERPNLQNIPNRGEYASEIRRAFIARDGYRIMAADYSQLELRIAAALSHDPKMIETFAAGEDIHARTAAEVFNVSLAQVTKDMRRTAKVLNFGVLYGMGYRAFAQASGISPDEARAFIDEYKTDFVRLSRYLEETKNAAYSLGYVETLWGRRRYLPELASQNPGLRAAGERAAINMPIQGTGADIIKAAMVELDREFTDDPGLYMILQVHDELVFEVRQGREQDYAARVRDIMTRIVSLDVPLEVHVAVGVSWGEMERI